MLYFLLNFSEVDQETEEEEKTFLLYGDEIFPHLNAFASSSWPPLRVRVQGEQVTPCRSFDCESICFKYSVRVESKLYIFRPRDNLSFGHREAREGDLTSGDYRYKQNQFHFQHDDFLIW